jgi:hypothetical protein
VQQEGDSGMSRNLKEKERMARRDVEKVRRLLRGNGVSVSDLLMLQRAHDRLLEIETAGRAKMLNKPLTDALKNRPTPEGMVQLKMPLPRYVYHGTSGAAAANILKEGITPRGDRTPNHPEEPSHPECVYLTDAYALAYIVDSFAGSRGAVLEVDLEMLMPNLLPDEDAVGVSGPGRDPRGVIEKMAEGTAGFIRTCSSGRCTSMARSRTGGPSRSAPSGAWHTSPTLRSSVWS